MKTRKWYRGYCLKYSLGVLRTEEGRGGDRRLMTYFIPIVYIW